MESTDLVERLRSKIRVYEDRMSSTATFMASRACSQDWDSVMRENQPRTDAQMMPEEYGQWLKNLSNQELDLYLKFRLTDAIPFTIVEAEAKKRGIR